MASQEKTNNQQYVLGSYKKNITSQFGEDGIFEELFKRIGPERKGLCIEVGSWDGKYCSNTWNLWHNQGWHAVLIEGNKERHEAFVREHTNFPNVNAINAYVTLSGETKLDSLLNKTLSKGATIDLLSIDIDGDDYYIWESLEQSAPRVVIIEFNPTIPPHLSLIQEPGQYFGASARAFYELAAQKGYALVAVTETNLIFVLREELPALGVKSLTLEEALPPELFSYVMSAYDGTTILTKMPMFSAINRPLSFRRIPRLREKQFTPVFISQLSPAWRMMLRPVKRGVKNVLGALGLLDSLRTMRETWRRLGRARTHKRKQQVLREYRARFGLSTLIETGTYQGDMVEAMKNIFSRIHSIELGEELYQKACLRFAVEPSITIHHGDSGEILPSILSTTSEPALFWLDAHYSRGDTALGSLETPIMKELSAILKNNKEHVILIDDARDFKGTHDYPTIPELESLLVQAGRNYELSVRDDIIRITPTKK